MKYTQALQATFDARQTHSLPAVFPDIPEGWTIPLIPTVLSALACANRPSSMVSPIDPHLHISLSPVPKFNFLKLGILMPDIPMPVLIAASACPRDIEASGPYL